VTNESKISKYDANERSCPTCAVPLPAHQTWPGVRYRFCGAADCAAKVKRLRNGRYIVTNEHKCEGPNCDRFVPEGRYLVGVMLTCCAECWLRRGGRGSTRMKCGCGCGKELLRNSKRKNVSGMVFFSPQHRGSYVRNKHLTDSCGAFREVVEEYLEGFVTLHYRNKNQVRVALSRFFLFLTEQGISSLEDVTPKIITQFLTWAEESGRTAAKSTTYISVFFECMIAEGRRESANPVVGLLHRQREKHRVPRPLEASELELAWQILGERGNARLRFAAAAAEEAGLRIGEICNLQIEDVDPLRQKLFVRLPNKSNRERWAFFSEKTKCHYIEWMVERNPHCGHDHLLHNTLGSPLKVWSLAREFQRILCKTYEGKTRNEAGFDKWSTHRLRHTMASKLASAGADAATVMASGGWTSYEAMVGYTRVEADAARRSYDEAMRRAHEQKHSELRKKSLTPADLLERRQSRWNHAVSELAEWRE